MKKRSVGRIRIVCKNPILLLAAGVLLVLVFMLSIRAFTDISDSDIVAYINGETVTVREYSQALLSKRNDIYAYFKKKYGVDDHAGFWTEVYEGEEPLNKIKNDTLELIMNRKVQQILARDHGIVQDISYNKILEDFKSENARRSKARKNNQVIYGPLQYGEQDYDSLVFSDMIAKLKQKLLKEMPFEEEELYGYYLKHQESYRRSGTMTVNKIIARYSDGETIGKPEAEKVMKEIKNRLEQGEGLDNIVEEYSGNTAPGLELEEQSFGPQTAKGDQMVSAELLEAAGELELGQISKILDVNGALIVMICMKKNAGDIISLEEAKEEIKEILFEQKYAALVEKLTMDAEIVINQEVYEKLGEEYLQ